MSSAKAPPHALIATSNAVRTARYVEVIGARSPRKKASLKAGPRTVKERTQELERDDNGGLDHIAPAPQHFQRMWDKKSGVFTPEGASDDAPYELTLAA
jgi:hypothetical protein